jgi:hypothetical protein
VRPPPPASKRGGEAPRADRAPAGDPDRIPDAQPDTDLSELVYLDGQGRVMAVTDRVDSLEFSKPEPLFTFAAATVYGLDRAFDVSHDGERFLFSGRPTTAPATGLAVELVVIQGWVVELKRLVPREP